MITSVYRTIILYVAVVAMLRFMGKRQIGELQPSELVATVFISNLASISVENPGDPLINSLLPILALGCLEVVISAISLKNVKFRKLISGSPIMVVRDGEIDQDALTKIRFSIDELFEQMRTSGYFSLDDIQFAIVETNGNLSFYPKFASKNISCEDLNIPAPAEDSPPVIVINDGQMDSNSLNYLGLREVDIHKILCNEQKKMQEVFLLYMDRTKKYTLIPKQDEQGGGDR